MLLFGVGFYFFIDTVVEDIQPRYREATEEPIVDTARVLASLAAVSAQDGRIDVPMFRRAFRHVHGNPFEAQIYSLIKTDVDVRVYITNSVGTVIFDSDQGREEGENYRRWRDVNLTLQGEYGARTSPSRLDPDTKVLYVAAPNLHTEDVRLLVSAAMADRLPAGWRTATPPDLSV